MRHRRQTRRALIALAVPWRALGWPARAARRGGLATGIVTEQGRVRLIAATARSGDAASVSLGLEFALAPHWKIYWRSPGDAGFPPRLDWTGSTNLAGATIAWPAPQRFSVLGLETVGYTDAVVLPITATLAQPGQAAHLHRALLATSPARRSASPMTPVLALDLPAGRRAPAKRLCRADRPLRRARAGRRRRRRASRSPPRRSCPARQRCWSSHRQARPPLAAPGCVCRGRRRASPSARRVLESRDSDGASLLRLPIRRHARRPSASSAVR